MPSSLPDAKRALIAETANRVALDILASQSGVEALRRIADAARVLAGAQYAALGVRRGHETELSHFIPVGLSSAQEATIGALPRGAGILGLLLERSEPLRIDVLADHPASVGFPANHPPMSSFLGVPIRRGETVIGSLYLTNKEGGGAFSESDEIAVQALGAHAAIAIYNLQMLERQRNLVSGLIHAQEEERRAVAYDLHDGLTQLVMASHAHLQAFGRAQSQGQAQRAAREWEKTSRAMEEAVTESRRLINGLRPLALDDLGLELALHQLVDEEAARADWQVDWNCNLNGERFDKNLETTAYRIAQEALTNARKHAQTARICVVLLRKCEQLTLQVRDWGVGFSPETVTGEGGRVGLAGMAERARLLDGELQVGSAPGAGTRISASFRLPKTKVSGESL